jgi:hypothetical protein
MWVLNVLPPAVLVWFFHAIPLPEIFRSIGFGAGVALALTVLSLIFLKEKTAVGIFVNLILLGFVLISYYLPIIDAKGDTVFLCSLSIMLPVMQAMLAMGLIQYLLVKPGTPYESPPPLLKYYTKPALYIGLLSGVASLPLSRAGLCQFSTAFLSGQSLAWFSVWTALYLLGLPARTDFAVVRDFIVQERGVRVKISQAWAVYAFLSFLLLCTVFEAFRGLWPLWGLIVLWSIFMFASMWRVWGFAFRPGEGTVWHCFEALGNYLEMIRTKMRPAELKMEADLSVFSRTHATFLSIISILFIIMFLLFFQTSPILFFIGFFALAAVINYLLKDVLKRQGIFLEDKLPLTVGMTFTLMTLVIFVFIYLVFFIIKQIIFG